MTVSGQITQDSASRLRTSSPSHLITMGSPEPGTDVFSPNGVSEGLKVLLAAYENPTPEPMKKLVQVMCFDVHHLADDIRGEVADEEGGHGRHLLRGGSRGPAEQARRSVRTSLLSAGSSGCR